MLAVKVTRDMLPTLAVVVRGESFRPYLDSVAGAVHRDVGMLQARASATHTKLLSVLCSASRQWTCTLDLYTYRPSGAPAASIELLSSMYAQYQPTVHASNATGYQWWWWRHVFAWHESSPAARSFAVLSLRFDMELSQPQRLGGRLVDAATAAVGHRRRVDDGLAPPILVAFRVASHLRLGLSTRGAHPGAVYRIRNRCPHVTARGRPRVADVLHWVPSAYVGLAHSAIFTEEIADRLSRPSQLGWLSHELADSDTWKCNNSLYTLNTRPSDRALAPQTVGVGDEAPPSPQASHGGRRCPPLDAAWWPELQPPSLQHARGAGPGQPAEPRTTRNEAGQDGVSRMAQGLGLAEGLRPPFPVLAQAPRFRNNLSTRSCCAVQCADSLDDPRVVMRNGPSRLTPASAFGPTLPCAEYLPAPRARSPWLAQVIAGSWACFDRLSRQLAAVGLQGIWQRAVHDETPASASHAVTAASRPRSCRDTQAQRTMDGIVRAHRAAWQAVVAANTCAPSPANSSESICPIEPSLIYTLSLANLSQIHLPKRKPAARRGGGSARALCALVLYIRS